MATIRMRQASRMVLANETMLHEGLITYKHAEEVGGHGCTINNIVMLLCVLQCFEQIAYDKAMLSKNRYHLERLVVELYVFSLSDTINARLGDISRRVTDVKSPTSLTTSLNLDLLDQSRDTMKNQLMDL